MAIYNYLHASTDHITEQDSYVLIDISRRSWPMTVAHYRKGFIIPVPPSMLFYKYEAAWREVGMSDSFISLMRYAQEQKATMVMLDADGVIIGELEQHGRNVANVCEERLARAERERDEAREEMKEAAGELLIPLPQSDPTVRKLLLANSIMRQERDAARADLERAQADVKRLREVELLAKDYRRAWKAFQAVPALHEETGSISWAEVDKAYGAAKAALEELLAALSKEAE